MNTRMYLGGVGLVAALALTACGGGGEAEEPAASGGAAGGGEATTLQVSADPSGALAFQPATLSAAANQEFTVEFSNPTSTGLPHNFVVVDQGQEDAVAQAALPNQGNVPDGTAGVRAGGEVQQPGSNEEVEVEGLPAGTYSYICTFPGHSQQMRGTLTVQ